MPGYYAAGHLMPKVSSFTLLILVFSVCILETVQDFLIKLDIKPLMHLLEINIFSLNKRPSQTYQNYEQPCQRSQNSEFQSHFSVSKIGRIFPKKICEEYLIRSPTYNKEILQKL